MHAVNAFLCEHNGYIRPGDAGNIAMVVYRAPYLVLYHVKRLALCAYLLSCNRYAAHALRGTLYKPVKVALSGRAYYHYVVRAVVRGKAHAAYIVLKAAGGYFRGYYRQRLRVYIVKVVRRRQRNAALERLGAILVCELAQLQPGRRLAPCPAVAARVIMLKVLKYFGNVDILFRIKFIFAHAVPPLELRRGFVPKPAFAKGLAGFYIVHAPCLAQPVNNVACAVAKQVALYAAVNYCLSFYG